MNYNPSNEYELVATVDLVPQKLAFKKITELLTESFTDATFWKSMYPDAQQCTKIQPWMMPKRLQLNKDYSYVFLRKTHETNHGTKIRYLNENECILGHVFLTPPQDSTMKHIPFYKLISVGMLKMPFIFGMKSMKQFLKCKNIWDHSITEIISEFNNPSSFWTIEGVCIQKELRGKGIGTKMMKRILEIAKSNVFLCTQEEHNCAFYTKLGFKVVDQRIIHFETDFTSWTMTKEFTGTPQD